jgi:hypothetical protein
MICIYKLNTNSILFGRFLEWDRFKLVTISKIESQVKLARVKTKKLISGWTIRPYENYMRPTITIISVSRQKNT